MTDENISDWLLKLEALVERLELAFGIRRKPERPQLMLIKGGRNDAR